MALPLKNLWFQDPKSDSIKINDTAVRIRASILILVPIFLSYTLYDAIFCSHWIVDTSNIRDTYDTDFDGHIIYAVEAIRETYDYTIQTYVLLYAFFDMLVSLSVKTSYLSPTIWIASFLARKKQAVWKPYTPKKVAWIIGATFISLCLIFFNPDIFAQYFNQITHTKLLPTDRNYMPTWIPLTLIWVCFIFMWLEATLGFCVGCQLHALMVKLGIFKEECIECQDIFSPQAQKAREEYQKQHSQTK